MRKVLFLSLLVFAATACASSESMSSMAAPSADVTGKWSGQWAYVQATLGSGQIEMTLQQTGAKVSGNMLVTGTPVDRSGAVSALVSGNTFQLVYPTGITGWLTVQGDTMSGRIDGMNPANVTMKKVQ
jgi:hypothetical protein